MHSLATNREEKFGYQYRVPRKRLWGKKSPVRTIFLFFCRKSDRPEGLNNSEKMPSSRYRYEDKIYPATHDNENDSLAILLCNSAGILRFQNPPGRSGPRVRDEPKETTANLRFSAVSCVFLPSCENLRFSAKICVSKMLFFLLGSSETLPKSVRICGNLRLGSVCPLGFVPLSAP